MRGGGGGKLCFGGDNKKFVEGVYLGVDNQIFETYKEIYSIADRQLHVSYGYGLQKGISCQ